MKLNLMFFALPALLATAATAETGSVADAKKDRRAPDYVRCRLLEVTGSLVKKEKICRTNREWEQLRVRGNSEAERFIEQNRTGTNVAG